MTSWQPYLWKEFRQNQRLVLVALGTFGAFTVVPWIIYSLFGGAEWYV